MKTHLLLFFLFSFFCIAFGLTIESSFKRIEVRDGQLYQNNTLTIRCTPADFNNRQYISVQGKDDETNHNVSVLCHDVEYYFQMAKIGEIPPDTRLHQAIACEEFYNDYQNLTFGDIGRTVSPTSRKPLEYPEDGYILGTALSAYFARSSPALGIIGFAITSFLFSGRSGMSSSQWRTLKSEEEKFVGDFSNFLTATQNFDEQLLNWNGLQQQELDRQVLENQKQIQFDAQVDISLNILQEEGVQRQQALQALAASELRNIQLETAEFDELQDATTQNARVIAETDAQLIELAYWVGNTTNNITNAINRLTEREYRHYISASSRYQELQDTDLDIYNLIYDARTNRQTQRNLNSLIQQHIADDLENGWTPFLPDHGKVPDNDINETSILDRFYLMVISGGVLSQHELAFFCNTTRLLDSFKEFRSVNQFSRVMSQGRCFITYTLNECVAGSPENFNVNPANQSTILTDLNVCDGAPTAGTPENWYDPDNFTDFIETLSTTVTPDSGQKWFLLSTRINQGVVLQDSAPIESTARVDEILGGLYGANVGFAIGSFMKISMSYFWITFNGFRANALGYLPNKLSYKKVYFARNTVTEEQMSCVIAEYMAYKNTAPFLSVYRISPTLVSSAVTVSIDGGEETIYTDQPVVDVNSFILPSDSIVVGDPFPISGSSIYNVPFSVVSASPNPRHRGPLYAMMANESIYNIDDFELINRVTFDPEEAVDPMSFYKRTVQFDGSGDDLRVIGCVEDVTAADEGSLCSIYQRYKVKSVGSTEFSLIPKEDAYVTANIIIPEGVIMVQVTSGCPVVTALNATTAFGVQFSNPGATAITFSVFVSGPDDDCEINIPEFTLAAGTSQEQWINSCPFDGSLVMTVENLEGTKCTDDMDVTTAPQTIPPVDGLASGGHVISTSIYYHDEITRRTTEASNNIVLDQYNLISFLVTIIKENGLVVTSDDLSNLLGLYDQAVANRNSEMADAADFKKQNADLLKNFTNIYNQIQEEAAAARELERRFNESAAARRQLLADLSKIESDEEKLNALADNAKDKVFQAMKDLEGFMAALNTSTRNFFNDLIKDLKPKDQAKACKGILGPVKCFVTSVLGWILTAAVIFLIVCVAVPFLYNIIRGYILKRSSMDYSHPSEHPPS